MVTDHTKSEGVQSRMVIGEPWTFASVSPDNLISAKRTGVGGRFSRWYSTAEPGRVFRITAIDVKAHAVETIFMGFETEPGTCKVEGDAETTSRPQQAS